MSAICAYASEGRFDNSKERHLYAVSDGTLGWHVITPLKTPEGEVVLVDRGFVPERVEGAVIAGARRDQR
jgi:cytochrome oxidase assembly protein ShyY1